MRLTFRLDTRSIAGRIVPEPEIGRLDLCLRGEFFAAVDLTGRDAFSFDDLPPGHTAVELRLPQKGEFRLKGLELSDGAVFDRREDDRPRWITYGSSITQCVAGEGHGR